MIFFCHNLMFHVLLGSEGIWGDGSATPMGGKSWTCRSGLLFSRSPTTVKDREISKNPSRQVIDLPRIRVAEPSEKTRDF